MAVYKNDDQRYSSLEILRFVARILSLPMWIISIVFNTGLLVNKVGDQRKVFCLHLLAGLQADEGDLMPLDLWAR
jgi:hypothetical protein